MFCGKVRLIIVASYFAAVAGFAQTSTGFTSLSVSGTTTSQHVVARERHLQPTSAGVLYSNSAFAHGFRHGYERGFYLGDFDLQTGRDPRILTKLKEYQPSRHEYDVAFGSKELFHEGYQAGFRSGYGDAVGGLEFRATARIRSASEGLEEMLPPTRRSHFDDGFASGYKSSQNRNTAAKETTSDYVEQYCRKSYSGPYSLEYCSGFSRGYMLGSSAPSPQPATLARSAAAKH